MQLTEIQILVHFQTEQSMQWDLYSPFANSLRPTIISHSRNEVTSLCLDSVFLGIITNLPIVD